MAHVRLSAVVGFSVYMTNKKDTGLFMLGLVY